MLLTIKYYILITLLDVAIGFKSGAPGSMCESMLPHHEGAFPQKPPPPYSLTTSSSRTQDGLVSLKVDGPPFLGIFIQARTNPETLSAIGSFINLPKSLKTIKCGNYSDSALTHRDNSRKEATMIEWMGPPNLHEQITFVATIVSNYSTFWTGIRSQPVRLEKYTSSQMGPEDSSIRASLYEECDTIKDCIGYPEGCIEQRNCQTFISLVVASDELEIEMMSLQSKYVSIGLSEDQKMGGDYVAECVVEGNSLRPYESWNIPSRKENVRLPVRDDLKLLNGDYTNGNIYCSLKISQEAVKLENFNLDFRKKRYYMLLAAGNEVKLQEGSQKTSGVSFHNIAYISSKNYVMIHTRPAKVEDPFYTGCNTDMNCFGFPDNCIQQQNCKLVVSIQTLGAKYRFRLKGESSSYIAVGLSDDDKMGADSVMECVYNGRNVVSFMSWNKAGEKFNSREGVSQVGMNLISGNFSNGIIFCEFTRETSTVVDKTTFDLIKDKYYLLLASGSSLKANSVGFHDLVYTSSGEKRFLSDVRALKTADRLLVKLHGAFMIAAWIGTASIGIVLARYFRQTWVDSSLCSKDLWFAWHRFFMLLTWCLTIAGCVLIAVDVGGWVPPGSQKHAIPGVVAIILCFIQPFAAAFRPHPTARHRPLFNWSHWFVGNAAHIVAIVTMFFAVPLAKAQLPDWVDWILVAFVAFYVSVHVILSFAGCISERRALKKINSFPMKEISTSRGNLNIAERKQDAPLGGLRKFMLFIHIVCITGLTAALIVIIVLAPIGEQWTSLQNKFMGM